MELPKSQERMLELPTIFRWRTSACSLRAGLRRLLPPSLSAAFCLRQQERCMLNAPTRDQARDSVLLLAEF